LIDLGLDGAFKLTQMAKDGKKTQYIEITGVQGQSTGAQYRSYVEIETIFDQQYYPEELEKKEIEFVVDQNTCTQVFAKFSQRLQILSDEEATVQFVASNQARMYELCVKSQHMESRVQSSLYQGTLRNDTEEKHEYTTTLKKDVFKRFFQIMKNSGHANLRINNQGVMEMLFVYEKCQYLNIVLETASRSI